MAEIIAVLLVVTLFGVLLSGFPVAFVLGGVSLLFAFAGAALDLFPLSYLAALPGRIYGIMTNDLLIAVPLFVFMGVTLERTKIAAELLETMAALFGARRAGLGISVLFVGALLAASTGIVGATVVTMGLISLPSMLKNGYCPKLSSGIICASGTLGQIIPPSVVLILLADQIGSAWQTAQMKAAVVSPVPVTIADLFMGAIGPGFALVGLYLLWLIACGVMHPNKVPPLSKEDRDRIFKDGKAQQLLKVLLPPLLLIVLVLGSILAGIATATESASVGALGALLIAWRRGELTLPVLQDVMRATTRITSMVFTILIGATIFTLVFRGYGGEDMVHEFLHALPGGLFLAMLLVMAVIFLLGFFLDFIEIIFIVVPIIAPILLSMGADPVWLAIMIAINLQTSFLTPPFGFSLFYLRGVAPKEIKTGDIYCGVAPFVMLQLVMLGMLAVAPGMATALPKALYGTEFTALQLQAGALTLPGNESSAPETWQIDF